MSKTSITQAVERLIHPILEQENLELVDVEYKKEGKNWFLRIFIDKDTGITLEDCRTVSRQLDDLIDVEGIIPNRYYLEVSSPGLDRPLKKAKDFIRYRGKKVQVTTFSAINGQKKFKGIIREFKEDTLVLEVNRDLLKIPLSAIAKAKLEIEL